MKVQGKRSYVLLRGILETWRKTSAASGLSVLLRSESVPTGKSGPWVQGQKKQRPFRIF